MDDFEKRLASLSSKQREMLQRNLAKKSKEMATKSATDNEIIAYGKDNLNVEIPLTSAQHQMWFFERLQPESGAYHLHDILHFTGSLSFDAMEKAFNTVIARHDTFRTSIYEKHGQPVQKVSEKVDFKLNRLQLTNTSEDEHNNALESMISMETRRPFIMSKAPLIRASLIELGPQEHVLVIVFHHIISDAMSIACCCHELETLYSAYCEGISPDLPEVTKQFTDFVRWQNKSKQKDTQSKQLDFWKKELSTSSGLLNLPLDKPRPKELSLKGDRLSFDLDISLKKPLENIANEEGVTLFMLLLAAFQTLLSRYTCQDDIIVGTPVSNREYEGLDSSIGLYVNTLALRGNLIGDPSFKELLISTRNHCLDAFNHGQAPLERIIDSLKLERIPGCTPLIQTMFLLINGDNTPPNFHGLSTQRIEPNFNVARFELTLSMFASPSNLSGTIDYNTDLFDAISIERLADSFNALLHSIIADRTSKLSELAVDSDKANESLLALGNGGISLSHVNNNQTLFDYIVQQANKTPMAIAIVASGVEVTYSELIHRSNGVAHKLHEIGVIPQSRVALLADRSIESLVGLLGILAAGAVYVPIDETHPTDRLLFVLEDAQIKAIVTPSALVGKAKVIAVDLPVLITEQAISTNTPFNVALPDDSEAYVIYTSGSTGMPKGVVVSHSNAINLVTGFLSQHEFEGQRLLMIPPLVFDASVGDIFPILFTGATLVLHANPSELGSIELTKFCEQFKVTAIDAPVALWRRWTEGFSQLQLPALPSINLMMFGGESVPLAQVELFSTLTGNRISLTNHYGPTEATVCATVLVTLNGGEFNGSDLPIGRPLPGVKLYIIDNKEQLSPRGTIGELCIGGNGVTKGYIGNSEKNSESFIKNPFVEDKNSKMYRTGDLVRWNNDGTLQFIGRADNQVKLRGFRIELGELETAMSSFEGVNEAVATICETASGDKKLVAYYVAENGVEEGKIKQNLIENLPAVMVPTVLCRLKELPLTVNGKVDKRALPIPSFKREKSNLILPQTKTEQIMLKVWQDVLGQQDLSIDDEFFNVGGDSLQTLPLVYKLRQEFSIDVPITSVFSSPSLQGLSLVVDQILAGTYSEEIDLSSKVVLPDEIYSNPALPAFKSSSNPKAIMITGATGFLGAYLLRGLLDKTKAKMLCLVRAQTLTDGLARIKSNMQTYDLWLESDSERIQILLGDLALPDLGFSQQTFKSVAHEADVIFHNGGQVNFLSPYESLEAANVKGTLEVLRLASTTKIKHVHFVSTLGIYLCDEYSSLHINENSKPPGPLSQYGGYNQSKWVAEQLMLLARDRGLPIAIYRPARITGDSATGRSNLSDYFNSWVKGCIQLKGLANFSVEDFDMAPVDYVAQAMVELSLGTGDVNGNYHFINTQRLKASDIVKVVRKHGFTLSEVSYIEWRQRLLEAIGANKENALSKFASLFPEVLEPYIEPDFDCTLTEELVAPFGIKCPAADGILFERYLRFMLNEGYLTEPESEMVIS